MSQLYVGLMSGTSLDGVDAALVRCASGGMPQTLAAVHLDYPPVLRAQVLQVCADQGGPFTTLGAIDIGVARLYAGAVQQLLQEAGVAAAAVRAIGAHGQTVHHQPQGDVHFTVQLGDPNTLAVLTGITVVSDFRRRDMALGGQGAPLAPAFHDAVLRHPTLPRVVLNCGGIANVSLLLPGQACIGYDTGPANILMDAWAARHLGLPYDRDGAWALSGQVHAGLLQALRADPYFALLPPKSTGREHFNLGWLEAGLARHAPQAAPADVQRTLLELTVSTITDAMARHADEGELLVAGGGAFNSALMQRLQALNPSWAVASTAAYGIPPEHVEAVAFAVFAQRTMDGMTGNLPAVTGASRACLLGGIYPP
jgi:anhydro-N-acetylmuramic acid kinase